MRSSHFGGFRSRKAILSRTLASLGVSVCKRGLDSPLLVVPGRCAASSFLPLLNFSGGEGPDRLPLRTCCARQPWGLFHFPVDSEPPARSPCVQAFVDGSFHRAQSLGSCSVVLVSHALHSRLSSVSAAAPLSPADISALAGGSEVFKYRLPSCPSSSAAELAAIAALLMILPATYSVTAHCDSEVVGQVISSIPTLPHRQQVRSLHRPLVRLVSELLRNKAKVGASVKIASVRAHRSSDNYLSAGNNVADAAAKEGIRSGLPLFAKLPLCDFPYVLRVGLSIPPGDPSPLISALHKKRSLQSWSESPSQSRYFSDLLPKFIAKVAGEHREALPFALALFSNNLPLRHTRLLVQRPGGIDLPLDNAVLLSLCPLCSDGLDDAPHLLHCASLSSLHSANVVITTFLRANVGRLPGPDLFGAFTRNSASWISSQTPDPDSFGVKCFLFWLQLWLLRRSKLPVGYSVWN